MISLAIVDDNTVNRVTVKEKLKPYKDKIEVVLEANNGKVFFDKLSKTNQSEFPDVVLMDLEMPVLDGISTIAEASVKHPGIKFIVLTVYEDNDKIFDAIRAGASGYLLKEDKGTNIMEAIENVVNYDGIPMSPAIARRAMKLLAESERPEADLSDIESKLSDREMDVLKEIVKGKSQNDIAEALFISPNTVRTHVNNIYKKLHLNSRSQIMNLAYKKKWI